MSSHKALGKIYAPGRVRRYRRGILAFHRLSPRDFPWRSATDPYSVLIGEVLLQRTTGTHVVAVYGEFLERFPDPTALASADPQRLAALLRPLGLVKRIGLLLRLGHELKALGRVPLRPAELESLPGVGRYTAHAVPIFAAHRNLPLVDWVIARVLRRYFGLPTERRRPNADHELWQLALAIVSPGRAREVWLGTLDLAAAVCKPRPHCDGCPLRRGCDFANA